MKILKTLLLSTVAVSALASQAQAAFFWEGLSPFVQGDGEGSDVVIVNTPDTHPRPSTVPQK